ncbi:MAG: radical SAM protein [Archaeoglobaceae archaeon]
MAHSEAGEATDQAQTMALIIERWLGNPVSKKLLGFLSARDGNGRRAEKVLKAYGGMKVDLTFKDKLAYLMVKTVIDRFSDRMNIPHEIVRGNLRESLWRKGLAATLEGLAWRGPTKPFVSYAPFLVVWNFTNACNLRCKHCYQRADRSTPDELTTQEAMDAVDEMADAGVAYIAFSGGEPLVRKDFFQIVERAKEREMGVAIATNGTHLTEDKVKKLEDLDCQYIQVSLDGLKKTHNKMRGSNAFERTIEGIENAVNSDITTGIAMTVTKDNLHEVDDVIDLAEEMGVDIFMHYNFIPTGRGRDLVELDISPREREELLTMLASESQKRELNILSTAPQYGRVAAKGGMVSATHFDTVGQDEEMQEGVKFLADFIGGCGCGRLYWALQPNGDLTPCVFFPVTLGNIRQDSFMDVWLNSSVLEKARKREEYAEKCSSCSSRSICGGCRARAYAYYGDVAETDPGCILNKKKWEELREKIVAHVHTKQI